MLVLCTQQQIERLLSCCTVENNVNIDAKLIIPEFKQYFSGDIQLFTRGDPENSYYKPLDGHFSSYIRKFQEYYIDQPNESDLWDLISRYAGTKVGDRLIEQNRNSQCYKLSTNVVKELTL